MTDSQARALRMVNLIRAARSVHPVGLYAIAGTQSGPAITASALRALAITRRSRAL